MSLPSFSLEGKVAVITGARRGLGEAIALGFAEAGSDVVICDIVVEDGKLEAVAEEIRKLGRRGLAVQTDVTKKADADKLIQRVVDEFGKIDILVNSAVATVRGNMFELSEEGWDKVLDTCVKGYFLPSQAAARKMVEQKSGNIINIDSTESIKAAGGSIAYTVAMGARDMLTETMAIELGRYNIRVNAIAPHMFRTEMTEMWWKDPEILKPWLEQIPLGRIGEPEDIVGAALFLASDASSWVTGHTLAVDGGYLAGDAVLPKARQLETIFGHKSLG